MYKTVCMDIVKMESREVYSERRGEKFSFVCLLLRNLLICAFQFNTRITICMSPNFVTQFSSQIIGEETSVYGEVCTHK